MTAQELYDKLRPLQESKGYFFNLDTEICLEILGNMLKLKDRCGYLICPCRLTTCDREKDRDILCPCDYREEDVKEYDFCYCGLYMSEQAHRAGKKRVLVPERRPVEKTLAAL